LSKELVNSFLQMVRIDSESGKEKEFISYLKGLFTDKMKAKCIIDNYGNLIIKIPSKKSYNKNPILFGVHADTVKNGKNIEPVINNEVIRSDGNTILGADDKAGIAELIEAINISDRHPPLEIAVSVEEEIGTKGSKNMNGSFIESKIGFVIDGTDLEDIVVGGPSIIRISIEITGKAAHSGMEPEKGISSIKAASYAISMIKEGWVDNETTVNIAMIDGGQVFNAVPEKTNVKIECRSISHEKCLSQSELIKDVFETAARSIGARAEVSMELHHKGYRISENSQTVELAINAVKSIGLKPNVKIICGGTDATNYNKKGIETVVIGTGGKAAHSSQENIAISDMEKAVDIIKHILEELGKKNN